MAATVKDVTERSVAELREKLEAVGKHTCAVHLHTVGHFTAIVCVPAGEKDARGYEKYMGLMLAHGMACKLIAMGAMVLGRMPFGHMGCNAIYHGGWFFTLSKPPAASSKQPAADSLCGSPAAI
jgi:hypothetical protein